MRSHLENCSVTIEEQEVDDRLSELPVFHAQDITTAEGGTSTTLALSPPSFAESQFDVILRRQRSRTTHDGGLKLTAAPSRFLNLSDAFEFAGWGNVSYLELSAEDLRSGELSVQEGQHGPCMGQWMASAVAANEVLGSVFYALSPVVAVAGVYSPISLFIATLTLYLWRPIFEELTSAIPMTGANYTYLINVASKTIALIAAAITLLDYTTTAVVSAAAASAYVSGEVKMPFPIFVGTILLTAIPMAVSLCGLKESARTAFAIMAVHGLTMAALCVASTVAWIRNGNVQLRDNWAAGHADSVSAIMLQIFNGICIGMLGQTGFECTPDYASTVKPGQFSKVLRNIHIPTIFLNAPIMLLTIAVLPMETVRGGANVLSLLAEHAGGRWLRIWVVVDAIIVLIAGVLTGILSACHLLERLALDRVVPSIFSRRIPVMNSQAVAILSFICLSGVLYASAGADLQILSKVFALTWLSVMFLFPLSVLLLKFNRGRLPRSSQTSLFVVLITFALTITVFVGNVVIDPKTLAYFAAYVTAILMFFLIAHNKVRLIRWLYWGYDQTLFLHRWRWMRRRSDMLIKTFRRLKRQPVCILTKSDEIHHLFRMVTYVHKNEQVSCLKLVHFYGLVDEIPSELEANSKLLDEAFPEITVDLVFVQASFKPSVVAALAHRLQIPKSLMFMSCPGPSFPMPIADFGTRIISL